MAGEGSVREGSEGSEGSVWEGACEKGLNGVRKA